MYYKSTQLEKDLEIVVDANIGSRWNLSKRILFCRNRSTECTSSQGKYSNTLTGTSEVTSEKAILFLSIL